MKCPNSKLYDWKIAVVNSKGKILRTYGYFTTKRKADNTLEELIKGRKFLRGK